MTDTSLTIVRRIKASPQAVFDAFIVPEKIALWWGPENGPVTHADIDPRKGGRFLIRFKLDDGTEHGSSGTFETFDPPHHLAMSWIWEGEDSPTSRVEVTLRAIEEGTELTFTHARLADAESRDGHQKGWTAALDKLEAHAETL